jgi:hypothetical protein
MKSLHTDTPAMYQIKVEGKLDPGWSDWFSGLTITVEGEGTRSAITTITGAVDQSTLRGVLTKIWDLNLTLISVHRTEMNSQDRYQV